LTIGSRRFAHGIGRIPEIEGDKEPKKTLNPVRSPPILNRHPDGSRSSAGLSGLEIFNVMSTRIHGAGNLIVLFDRQEQAACKL
jgi:hypothetical protein